MEAVTDADRANQIREAMAVLAMDRTITIEEHWALNKLARIASDELLARLGRMLR